MAMGLPELGARVLIGPRAATVRYVGTVDGHAGTWVGLEWDDASHGKHGGSVGGRRYFACASGAAAGTLVRAEKFAAAADFGVTVLDALRLRCRPILEYSSGAWRQIITCCGNILRLVDHAKFGVCLAPAVYAVDVPATNRCIPQVCLPSATNHQQQVR